MGPARWPARCNEDGMTSAPMISANLGFMVARESVLVSLGSSIVVCLVLALLVCAALFVVTSPSVRLFLGCTARILRARVRHPLHPARV
jgi:hypothetical protein